MHRAHDNNNNNKIYITPEAVGPLTACQLSHARSISTACARHPALLTPGCPGVQEHGGYIADLIEAKHDAAKAIVGAVVSAHSM